MKIYFYGANASGHGFSNVTHHICTELSKYHDVINLAYDDFDNYDKYGNDKNQTLSYKVINLTKYYQIQFKPRDQYCIEAMLNYISEYNNFDIFICSCDLHVAHSFADRIRDFQKLYKFKTVAYIPIDTNLLNVDMVNKLSVYDFIVTYNQFSANTLKLYNANINPYIIPLGCDFNTLYPYTKDELNELQISTHTDNVFTILNVNKNQPRKCIDRTIMIFARFLEKYKILSHLYLKCRKHDNGISLNALSSTLGLDNYITFIEDIVDSKELRKIYNVADIFISTSSGEGHGLSSTEAMQCKTPVLLPLHTSTYDILGENNIRGWYIECNDMSYIEGSSRFLCDIENGADQLKRIYDLLQKNHKHDLDKVYNAFLWCKENTWEYIVKDNWLTLLDTIPSKKQKGVFI